MIGYDAARTEERLHSGENQPVPACSDQVDLETVSLELDVRGLGSLADNRKLDRLGHHEAAVLGVRFHGQGDERLKGFHGVTFRWSLESGGDTFAHEQALGVADESVNRSDFDQSAILQPIEAVLVDGGQQVGRHEHRGLRAGEVGLRHLPLCSEDSEHNVLGSRCDAAAVIVDDPRMREEPGEARNYVSVGVNIGDINLYTGTPVHTNYRSQVARIAPEQLQGRERELAELRAFCQSPQTRGQYWWWRAEAWSGKSALMSWFVLHPPERVRIISFFVTARWASQNNRLAFIANVLEQLLAMLGETAPALLNEYTQEAHLLHLIPKAAAACADRGEEFVLLVDGLDEDRGVTTGPDAHSIAQLLPAHPPAGMRVIIAGRPNPPTPSDVPDDHPLKNPATARELVPWAHAQAVRADMERELKALLADPRAGQNLLGLVVAAGGGLTAADLAELLPGWSAYEVNDHLCSVAGRSFTARASLYEPDRPERYVLGHEELQLKSREMLGSARLDTYRARLHEWADDHRARQWPVDTPEYLLSGYGNMLAGERDLPRLAGLAADPARHERLLSVSGGDVTALAEIAAAQNLVLAQEDPDLPLLARLVFHRDRLNNRNTTIPVAAPGLWYALGRAEQAWMLACSIPDSEKRGDALRRMVEAALSAGDLTRAVELTAAIPSDAHRSAAVRALVDNATSPTRTAAVLEAFATHTIRSFEDDDGWDASARSIAVKALAFGLDVELRQAVSVLAAPLPVPMFLFIAAKELFDRAGTRCGVDVLTEAAKSVRQRYVGAKVAGWLMSIAVAAAALGQTAMAMDLFDEAMTHAYDEEADFAAAAVAGTSAARSRSQPPFQWTNPPLTFVAAHGDVGALVERAADAAERNPLVDRRFAALTKIAKAAMDAGETGLAVEVACRIGEPFTVVRVLANLPGVPGNAFAAPLAGLRTMREPVLQVDALLRAAAAMTEVGDLDQAGEVVDLAVTIARGLESPKLPLVQAAVLTHAIRGEQAGLRVLELLPDEEDSTLAHLLLTLCASWHAMIADDVDAAMKYVRQAVDIVGAERRDLREGLVGEIVSAMTAGSPEPDDHVEPVGFQRAMMNAGNGMLDVMTAAPDELVHTVVKAIQLVPHPGHRIQMLSTLGHALADRGHVDLGREVVRSALAVAQSLDTSPTWRDDVLQEVMSAAVVQRDASLAEAVARAFFKTHRQNAALVATASVSLATRDMDRVTRIVAEIAAFTDPRLDVELEELLDTVFRDVRIGSMPVSEAGFARVASPDEPPWFASSVDQAAQLVATCEGAALFIADSGARGRLLVLLAGAAREVGDIAWAARLLTQAEETARTSLDADNTSAEIIAAVRAGAKGLAEQALAAVRRVNEPRKRVDALAELACADSGDARAASLLDLATAEALQMPDQERDPALNLVVTAAIQCGALAEAESAAMFLPFVSSRAPALMSVGAALMRAGNGARGSVLIKRSRKLVEDKHRENLSSELAVSVAQALRAAVGDVHDVGEQGGTAELLDLIVRLAADTPLPVRSDEVRMKAVEAAIHVGDLDRAEVLAGYMRTELQQSQARRLICHGAALAGEIDRAEENALRIASPAECDRALRLLVEVLVDRGELNRAESVARSVMAPGQRVLALHAVANAVAGDANRAAALLDLADATLADVVDLLASDVGCGAVVAAFAAGDRDRALGYLQHVREALAEVSHRRRPSASLEILTTLVAGIGADEHPEVVDLVREIATSPKELRVVAEEWGTVPWLERTVLDLEDSEDKYEILLVLARRASPAHARRLMARAMVVVPWRLSLPELSERFPEAAAIVVGEAEASIVTG
ncbi:hypothetical protein AB0E59_32570 [Lentzea sp. NPDC034063]|uniref:hypothetical protein n=1 Tax=unclassified Lentzea TaxID=2643253 RepID=UPI0033D9E67A